MAQVATTQNKQPTLMEAFQQTAVILPLPGAQKTQAEATDIILKASHPVIVITGASAQTYAGMMKYVSESFPHVPIIFETPYQRQPQTIDDRYMANHVMKGTMNDKRAKAHFTNADVVIVLGQDPSSIHAQATEKQIVLSGQSVQNGVNIAIASLQRSDEFKAKATQWRTWNTRCISPGRCPV
jgi:hypothetical protein